MPSLKRICLIEFNGYHEECLFSQLLFLKESGYWVSLIVHKKMEKRIKAYSELIDDLKIVNTGSKVFFLSRLITIVELKRHLDKNKITKVVFNTASSNKETIILSFLLRKKLLFGILHDLHKLKSSFSQKLISKNIKNYFVLNDTLLKNRITKIPGIRFERFYPIFFQKYHLPDIQKTENDLWITIPGKIEIKRRDYKMIISVLKHIPVDQRPTILLLGNLSNTEHDHQQIRQLIVDTELASFVKTFEGFIPNSIFHAYVEKSDFLLLPKASFGEHYADTKIMGAYNLAFSYKKPIIFPASLQIVNDLSENGISYVDQENLQRILNKEYLKTTKIETNYTDPKWNFETQCSNYIEFIEA